MRKYRQKVKSPSGVDKREFTSHNYGCQGPNILFRAGAFVAMISQTAEYALRAIVYLAGQEGAACTTTQIANTTQIPAGYLAKVMQSLSRARLVKSRRGVNGGFILAHDSRELSILTVINAVDPIQRFSECPLGIPSHGPRLCPLHHRLDQAAEMVEDAFGKTMVAELLAVPQERRPLCRFPLGPPAISRQARQRGSKQRSVNGRPSI
jgi:Rrf2 family protein